jgi:CheY-like chemotaxis protein
MLTDVLASEGYRVLTAGDGMEAFKAVIAEKPHVIITDKELPKLDGYALFDALAKVPETRFIPVILVTGTAMKPEEEAKAFDKGFFDFIIKPVAPITLKSRVKRAFQFYDHQYRLV